MTEPTFPRGHRRTFESVTRGDYGKLRNQPGIFAVARLRDLRHTHVSHAIMYGEPARLRPAARPSASKHEKPLRPP